MRCCLFQILKGKLNLPPYLTNEARSLIKKVSEHVHVKSFCAEGCENAAGFRSFSMSEIFCYYQCGNICSFFSCLVLRGLIQIMENWENCAV